MSARDHFKAIEPSRKALGSGRQQFSSWLAARFVLILVLLRPRSFWAFDEEDKDANEDDVTSAEMRTAVLGAPDCPGPITRLI